MKERDPKDEKENLVMVGCGAFIAGFFFAIISMNWG